MLLTCVVSSQGEWQETGEIYVGGIKTSHSWDPASLPLKERSGESLGNRGCVLIGRPAAYFCVTFVSSLIWWDNRRRCFYINRICWWWRLRPERELFNPGLEQRRFSGPYGAEMWNCSISRTHSWSFLSPADDLCWKIGSRHHQVTSLVVSAPCRCCSRRQAEGIIMAAARNN